MLQSQIAKRAKLSKWFLFNTLGKLPTHSAPFKVQVPGACLSFWPHLQPLVLLSPTLQSSRTPGLLYASITLLVCSLSTKAGSHFLSLPHYRLASWTPTLPLRWSIHTCCKLDHSSSFSDGLTDSFLLSLLQLWNKSGSCNIFMHTKCDSPHKSHSNGYIQTSSLVWILLFYALQSLLISST